jgi:hypothetical protein
MTRRVIVALIATAIVGIRAFAHHSQVAVYETTRMQTVQGKVVAVQIRSPHSWVHVEVDEKDTQGKRLRYAMEWGSAAQLTRAGIDGKTLKINDVIKVSGRPGRNPADRQLLVITMVRPSDGWKWPTREGEVVD